MGTFERMKQLESKYQNHFEPKNQNYFDTNGKLLYSSDHDFDESENNDYGFPNSIQQPEEDFKNRCPEDPNSDKVIIHHKGGAISYDIYKARYGIMDGNLHAEILAKHRSGHNLFPDLTIKLYGLGIHRTKPVSFVGYHRIAKNMTAFFEEELDNYPTLTEFPFNYNIDHNEIVIKLRRYTMLSVDWTGVIPNYKNKDGKIEEIKIEIKCTMSDDFFK